MEIQSKSDIVLPIQNNTDLTKKQDQTSVKHTINKAIKILESLSINHVSKEFDSINQIYNHRDFHDKLVKIKKEERRLNRYIDIVPYRRNSVILKVKPDSRKSIKTKLSSSYINASYIYDLNKNSQEVDFIATQGPIRKTIEYFWHMIWQEYVDTIIMLCNTENQACNTYWPELNETISYGEFDVKLIGVKEPNKFYQIRELELTNTSDGVTRKITQYNSESWPDRQTPYANQTAYVEELLDITIQHRKTIHHPIAIHCSAGVGRTGTLIALHYLTKLIKDSFQNCLQNTDTVESKDCEIPEFSIYQTVNNQRKLRVLMVQTEEQYIYIHDFIKSMLKRLQNVKIEPKQLPKKVQEKVGSSDNSKEDIITTKESQVQAKLLEKKTYNTVKEQEYSEDYSKELIITKEKPQVHAKILEKKTVNAIKKQEPYSEEVTITTEKSPIQAKILEKKTVNTNQKKVGSSNDSEEVIITTEESQVKANKVDKKIINTVQKQEPSTNNNSSEEVVKKILQVASKPKIKFGPKKRRWQRQLKKRDYIRKRAQPKKVPVVNKKKQESSNNSDNNYIDPARKRQRNYKNLQISLNDL